MTFLRSWFFEILVQSVMQQCTFFRDNDTDCRESKRTSFSSVQPSKVNINTLCMLHFASFGICLFVLMQRTGISTQICNTFCSVLMPWGLQHKYYLQLVSFSVLLFDLFVRKPDWSRSLALFWIFFFSQLISSGNINVWEWFVTLHLR